MPTDKMKQGFRKFKEEEFLANLPFFKSLAAKQEPKVMVIGCCDSRADPALITNSGPGELFVVRNVANLVPSCDNGTAYPGASSAMEYAVQALQVEHIVVLGHWGCGGMKALLERDIDNETSAPNSFINHWLDQALEARKVTKDTVGDQDADTQLRFLERESIKGSLKNLMTYPWIAERVEDGRLQLHGWYFDLNEGNMYAYGADGDRFDAI